MTATIQPQTVPGEAERWESQRYDLAAERAILGCLMLNPTTIAEAEAKLAKDAFYRPIHGKIFEAVAELAAEGKPTDAIAVAARLADRGYLGEVGGGPYLCELMESVPLVANIGHYIRIVAGLHQLRILRSTIDYASQLLSAASHDEADQVTQQILDRIVDTNRATTSDDGPKPWSELVGPLLDEIEARGQRTPEEQAEHVITTGWTDVDRQLCGGGKPGQLIVIAGRPGSGKSISAMCWAQHAAMDQGIPAAVFSLEMGKTELGCRLAAAATGVPLHKIDAGDLDDRDWVKLGRWAGDTSTAPLFIDDTPTMTVADIRARSRRLKQQHGIRMIVVDYLQLVSSGRAENRQAAVAAMSRGFKLLAKELECVVILVAQLNRGPESRQDKRPEVSDLRESGAIEADADTVILVHAMDSNDSPRAGEVDLIIGKQRGGPTGTQTLADQRHFTRFVSMALEDAP